MMRRAFLQASRSSWTRALLFFAVSVAGVAVLTGGIGGGGSGFGTSTPEFRVTYQWSGDGRFDMSRYIGSGGVDRVVVGFDLETALNVARILESAKENGREMYRPGKLGDSRALDIDLLVRVLWLGVVADSSGWATAARESVWVFADSSWFSNTPPKDLRGVTVGNGGGWGVDSLFANDAWDSVAANVSPAVCFIFNAVNDVGGFSLGDTTGWRDSTQAVVESLIVRDILPVLTSDIPAVAGGVFNDPVVLAMDRQKRYISEELDVPFLDIHASFMDAAALLVATRPAEFPTDSVAIFGNLTAAAADSGLVRSSDKLHATFGASVTTGTANSRNWSTQAILQKSGQARMSMHILQFMDFLRQLGEAEGDVGGP